MAYIKFLVLAKYMSIAATSMALYSLLTQYSCRFEVIKFALMLIPVLFTLIQGPFSQRIYWILLFYSSAALGVCVSELNGTLNINPGYNWEVRGKYMHFAMSYFLISEAQYWRYRLQDYSLQSEGTYRLGVALVGPRLRDFNKWIILAFSLTRTMSWYYLYMLQLRAWESKLRGDTICDPLWPKQCFIRGMFFNTGYWWADIVLDLPLLRWKRAVVDWFVCSVEDVILRRINSIVDLVMYI